MRTLFYILFVAAIFSSCQNRKVKVYEVPDEVQPYVSTFIMEAYKRGHRIIIDDLIITYKFDIITSGVHAAGLCRTRFGHTPIIYIDTTTHNWKNSEMTREQLVFHELGHCILGRGHRKDTLLNGNYASIMRPTGEILYGSPMASFKRDYYLDELFDINTEQPSWTQNTEMYETEYEVLDTILYQNFVIDSLIDSIQTDSLLITDSIFQETWSLGQNSFTDRTIFDGQLQIQSFKRGTYITPFEVNLPEDSSFEIRLHAYLHVHSLGGFAFYWGGENVKNIYALIANKKGYVSVGKVGSGVVFSQNNTSFKANQYNEILIRKRSDNYYIYINGELLDKFRFAPFLGNLFGFGISNAPSQIWIDNILVTIIQ